VGRTVLVADDSPSIQNKAKGILTGEGLEVVTVSNGVAAIKKLPQVKPLLVLADVSMPGKDGYEVCEFVKNSAELAHVPVVLIFSEIEPYDETRGRRAGANGTIQKRSAVDPFDQEELVSTVNRFLAQSEAAAPQAAPPPPPLPESSLVNEPVDEEPVVGTFQQTDDVGPISADVAFGDTAFEEPAAPAGFDTFMPAESTPEAAAAGGPSTFESPWAQEQAAPEPPARIDEVPLAAEPAFGEAPAAEPEPPPEQTMVFRAPVEIAEPILSDEFTASEQEPRSVLESAEAAAQEEVAASSLDSYSLTDAASGHVRFAPGEEAATPVEAEPEIAPSGPVFDRNWIYSIVHRVVVKMSPPALPAATVEEMANRLTDEILADLNTEAGGNP
jgi:CheY-like chemotaxis protein